MTPQQIVQLAAFLIVLAVVVAVQIIFFKYFRLWLRAFLSGAPVSIFNLLAMTFRKVNGAVIVNNMILARHSGVQVTTADLERAYLRGVDVEKVTLAAIEANRLNMQLTFEQLVAAELEGRLAEKLGHSR